MTTKPPAAPKKPAAPKQPSAGKTAYEQQRAAKAGKSHEEWLKAKAKTAAAAKAPLKPAKKPSLISRLLDKAHKPIGK